MRTPRREAFTETADRLLQQRRPKMGETNACLRVGNGHGASTNDPVGFRSRVATMWQYKGHRQPQTRITNTDTGSGPDSEAGTKSWNSRSHLKAPERPPEPDVAGSNPAGGASEGRARRRGVPSVSRNRLLTGPGSVRIDARSPSRRARCPLGGRRSSRGLASTRGCPAPRRRPAIESPVGLCTIRRSH